MAVLVVGADAAPQQPRAPFDLEEVIARNIAPGQRVRGLVEALRPFFHVFDLDVDGTISAADQQRRREIDEAAARAVAVSEMLRADLDGDGNVTRAELARYQTHLARVGLRGEGPDVETRRQRMAATRIEIMMRADLDGNGRIEWSEILAHFKAHVVLQIGYEPAYRVLLAFDADGDGKTTMAEFEEALERRFAAVDADGDGVISRGEFESYWQRLGRPAPAAAEIPPNPEEERVARCKLPRAPRDAKIVMFSSGTGMAISTVAIGSQGETTTASRITVEPGPEPLYLVLTSWDRIIWQFDGAVERVKRVVLAALADDNDKPMPVAATGLSADVITFGRSGECMSFWGDLIGKDKALAHQTLRLLAGREPDLVRRTDDVWNLRLPSGEVADPTDTERQSTFPFDPDVIGHWSSPKAIGFWRVRDDLFASFPGGVVRVDPKMTIASVPVENYEVLPEQAGLLQLILEGALEYRRWGEFIIRKPMRFPAGLNGFRAVKYVLPKGAPDPTGDSGASLVVSEETGRVLCFDVSCRERGN